MTARSLHSSPLLPLPLSPSLLLFFTRRYFPTSCSISPSKSLYSFYYRFFRRLLLYSRGEEPEGGRGVRRFVSKHFDCWFWWEVQAWAWARVWVCFLCWAGMDWAGSGWFWMDGTVKPYRVDQSSCPRRPASLVWVKRAVSLGRVLVCTHAYKYTHIHLYNSGVAPYASEIYR